MLETRRSHVTRGVQPSTMDGLFPLSRYAEVVLVRERITEICSPNHQVKKVKKASKPHGGLENDLCFHEKDVQLRVCVWGSSVNLQKRQFNSL